MDAHEGIADAAIRLVQELKHNPNIIPPYDVGQWKIYSYSSENLSRKKIFKAFFFHFNTPSKTWISTRFERNS